LEEIGTIWNNLEGSGRIWKHLEETADWKKQRMPVESGAIAAFRRS
jgi:hypothetical protein